MKEEIGNITSEDIDQAILSLEEEGLPLEFEPAPEIQPATAHRRAMVAVPNIKSGRGVVLLIPVLLLAGFGCYYLFATPEPRVEVTPAAPLTEAAVATVPADTGLPVAKAGIATAPVAEAPAVQTAGNGATITGKEITANRPKAEAVLNASAPRPLPPAPAAPTVSPEVGPATYTVLAGLYRRQSGLEKAEKVIRNLGFQPEVVTLTEEKEMIRLLVGTFPRDEAQRRLAALRTEVPDAFLLGQGDRASIYAGSFSSAEYARQQAARLAGKGIETGTEVVRVPITGYRISFGVFADRDAARKAAERAAAEGLAAPLVKAL